VVTEIIRLQDGEIILLSYFEKDIFDGVILYFLSVANNFAVDLVK